MISLLRSFMPFGLPLLVVVFLLPSNPDLLRQQQWYGALFFSCLVGLQYGLKTKSVAVAAAFSYFLIIAALNWSARWDVPYWSMAEAGASSLVLLLLVVGLTDLTANRRRAVKNALGLLCLISSGVLIGRRALGQEVIYFFMNNAAADACLIAVLYPFLTMRPDFPFSRAKWAARAFYTLPLVAIAVSGSSTAWVALCCTMLVFFLAIGRVAGLYRLRNMLIGSAIVATLMLAGVYLFSPDEPFNNNGRVKIWRDSWAFINRSMGPEALERFRERVTPQNLYYLDRKVSLFTGVGSGSFRPLSEPVQDSNFQTHRSIFPFAHNDWFQVIFEQGLIGFFLLLAVGLHAVYKALARPWLLASLLTYGAIMVVQFPFRYFGSALIGVFLLVEAFMGNDNG